ncbi:MAG: histidine phosphatase family protein [Deltaproteobacteria bacterium]
MIYLVRDGQSTANAGGVTMAHAQIPLSELGRRPTAMVADLLDVKPTLLFSLTPDAPPRAARLEPNAG